MVGLDELSILPNVDGALSCLACCKRIDVFLKICSVKIYELENCSFY